MSLKYGKWVRGGKPDTKKFDMLEPPHKQAMYLMPLVWAFSDFQKNLHRAKLHKVNMEGIKPPYILVCNHNAFFDFYIMSRLLMPHTGYFPAAVDDFIGREFFLRNLGGIPKRKYTADLSIIRNCKKAIQDGQIFGIYAEARYSHCGKTEVIPDSVGQLCKYQNVPVVTLKMSGHHLYQPFWNSRRRYIKPVEATMTCIYKPEELKTASADEINAKLREYLFNDDFKWQYENKIRIPYKNRAKGLHKVLYQCPSCMTEYKMKSEGSKVFCEHCGKSWTLGEYGDLKADSGETEFKFPTDWYDWEREQVKKQVLDGTYRLECDCDVNDLPNAKGFVHIGHGKLVHDLNGFKVEVTREYDNEPMKLEIPAASQYACHIEYDYRFGKRRDCIDLNTMEDTWYVFPENCDFSVTKVALATEEIFNEIERKRKEEKAAKKAAK